MEALFFRGRGLRSSGKQGNSKSWAPQGAQGPLCTRIVCDFAGRARHAMPLVLPSAGGHSHSGHRGQTPPGVPTSAGWGDSLGLSCFSSRPASLGAWSPLARPPRSGGRPF